MKLFLITVCAIYMAYAAPSIRKTKELAAVRALPALEREEIRDEYGQYALRYVTAEGIVVSEQGRLVPDPDGSGYVLITEGEIFYIGDDGEAYITRFTAGLDGTHAVGNHLPVAPKPIVPEMPISDPTPVSVPLAAERLLILE